MPKPVLNDDRYDFRKGRNTAISPDLLNSDELVDTTNARLSASYGAFTKRSGCQRIHPDVLGLAPGSPIRGLIQWDGPSGKQIVAIVNGELRFRNGFNYAQGFSALAPPPGDEFSTTEPALFAPFRASASGAPLVLFIASGGKFYTWNGTATLTRIDGATPVLPPDADLVIAYHTRLFVRDLNYKKHIFWSKVGDGTSYTTGSKVDGGSAFVDVLNGEEIVALEVIGSSLLMASEDCVMRFTGHATDDIVISQDTEGVSTEVGAVGKLALKRFENLAAMLSDRGPYVVTETGVEPIGEQVAPDFAALDLSVISKSIIGWNRGRKELLYAVPRTVDGALNKTIYAQAARLQAWYGPWIYSFGITYLARYEDANGNESVISGGADGWIRDMDVGVLDDVLYNSTGGTNIEMLVEMPVIQFGVPGTTKALSGMELQANLPSGSALEINTLFDDESAFVVDVAVPTLGLQNQRIDMNGQGKRLRMQFKDASAQMVAVHGFSLHAWDYERR